MGAGVGMGVGAGGGVVGLGGGVVGGPVGGVVGGGFGGVAGFGPGGEAGLTGTTAGLSGATFPSGGAGVVGISGAVTGGGVWAGVVAGPRSMGATGADAEVLNAPAPHATSPMLSAATTPATPRMSPLLLPDAPWLLPRCAGTEACGTPPGGAYA